MKTYHPIFLVACVTAISGCGDSDTSRKDTTTSPPPEKSMASPKPMNLPLKPSLSLPQPTQTRRTETVERLAEKVQGARVGSTGRAAIVAMHELLKQWSPIGKKTNDVKKMLGKPSEEDQAKLVYRFDDGDQTYEWTMKKEGNLISSLSIMLRE